MVVLVKGELATALGLLPLVAAIDNTSRNPYPTLAQTLVRSTTSPNLLAPDLSIDHKIASLDILPDRK